MCGIAGLVDLAGVDDAAASRLDAALDRLSRRGPDGRGRWRDRHCLLGHTRLAIIDLSPAGAQPMIGHGFAVTQNGEIYNYRALREELRGRGHAFATESDTEVLLAGWREWGESLLPRLVGMFAFALWDAESGELVLVRDRFGKKPLLYRTEGTRLAFASDLLALERLWGATFPLDPEAVRLLFALRYVPEPWSIASDVHKVPAGHIACFSRRGLELRPWYELPRGQSGRFRDEGEAAEELRARLDSAVLDRTEADVPVGAFLSSGLDSSIIVSSLARQTNSVRTFTVGFPGASGYYEERPAARELARRLGTDHNEIEIEANDAREALDGVIDGLDEPFADSSALPAFLLSKATRRHVKVALSGDGADELFGGYRKHLGELYAERYRRLPAWLRRVVIEPAARRLPEGKDSFILEGARRLRRFAAHAGKPAAERQAGWARLLEEGELDRLLAPGAGGPSVEELVVRARAGTCGGDAINAMLAAEIRLGLVGDMLVKIDRMSMANSLEVRCPWLDHRIVECALAMPGAFKLRDGVGKRILRIAFADRLPPEVFERPKKGFEAPVARWLAGELRDLVEWAIEPSRLRRQGLFRPGLPRRWFDDLVAGRRDDSWALWTLVVFQRWCEHHRRPESIA